MEVTGAEAEAAAGERVEPFEIGCFSDYGTLSAVMVGRTDDLAYPAWSPNIRYLSGAVAELLSNAEGDSVNLREQAPELWEGITEDVEGIVEALRRHGAEVVRPRKFLPEEMTYLEYLQGGHSLLYPADPTYVVGKHVVETTFRRPFSRKETWATRDVLMPSIEADPRSSRGLSAPRPHPAGDEGPGPFLEGGDHHDRRRERPLRHHRADVQRGRARLADPLPRALWDRGSPGRRAGHLAAPARGHVRPPRGPRDGAPPGPRWQPPRADRRLGADRADRGGDQGSRLGGHERGCHEASDRPALRTGHRRARPPRHGADPGRRRAPELLGGAVRCVALPIARDAR